MISTVHVLVFLVFMALVIRGTRIDEDRHHQQRRQRSLRANDLP